jgi:iron complex transport system substrate-binding protein
VVIVADEWWKAVVALRRVSTVMVLAAACLAGCERKSGDGVNDGAAAGRAAERNSATRPVSGLNLRDYTVEPIVAEEEREPPAMRIVSLAPSITEICCALGLAEQIVGRTRYCAHPPAVQAATSLGGLHDLSREVLVSLRPEIVFAAGKSRQTIEALEGLSLRYVALPDATLGDLEQSIGEIGNLVGRPRTAELLIANIRADLERVAAAVRPDEAGASVLLVTGVLSEPPSPPFVAGPGSFYDELLTRAGYHNACAGLVNRSFCSLSLEALLKADPAVIIELDPDGLLRPGGDAAAAAVWGQIGSLRAVERGRVHVIRGPELYLLGPRVAIVFERIAEVLRSKR